MYSFFPRLNHKILNIMEKNFGQFFYQQTAQSYAQDSEYNGEILDSKLHSHMHKILNIMENFFGQFFEQQTAQSYA